jgi:hypothetical protein
MIFETHTLDQGMDWYYKRVTPHFPYAACLGLTDMGDDPSVSRAFIAFATSKEFLNLCAVRDFVRVEPYFRNIFLEKYGTLSQQGAWALAAKCFEQPSSRLWSDREYYSFGREGYFEVLLAGLHQFRLQSYTVSDENIYCKFMIENVSSGILDQKLSGLMDNKAQVKRKISNKYEDMINVISGHPDRVPPIILIRDDLKGTLRFRKVDGESISCSEIDGHHRFFAFQLMGLERIHCIGL